MDVNILKREYIKQDRSVNIQKYLKEKEFIEKNNLQNVEIVNKVKSLGKDDFLKLLITQLSHQDPTKPMSDQEFIAQMAQFSSLEQMQNIAHSIETMNKNQNFNYLGKFVIGKDSISGEEISGIVDAIFKDESGEVFLKVKDSALKKEDVYVIGLPKDQKLSYQQNENLNHKEIQRSESRLNLLESRNTEILQKNHTNEQQNQIQEYHKNIIQN